MSILHNSAAVNCANMLRITVSDSGYAQVGPEWNRWDVCSPYTRIYYVHRGCGEAISGSVHTPLLPEHIYLIPIGYHYDYRCAERFDHLYFHVSIPQATGLDLFSSCESILSQRISSAELARMIRLYHSSDASDALMITCKLYEDIAAFVSQHHFSQQTPPHGYTELLQRLFPLIHEQLSSKLTIASLAAELNVSPSTLTKRFHRELGKTLGEYIDSMLFQRAQNLLIATEMSIGEISDLLEFCDQFYFSRFFKQHQGETPTAYRKRLKL